MTDRVAVIGAGQMGNGIAHVFAQSGIPVTMIDVSEDALRRGRETIEKNIDRQVKKNTLSADDKQAAIGRIATSTDLRRRRRTRRSSSRRRRRTPISSSGSSPISTGWPPAGAILASNTSSISITQIAAQTKRPELVIGMHFMNPVPVMQLVEVIRGLATSDATTRRVMDLAKALGKTPVEANDFPGLRREPDSAADDQRGVLRAHGRRRHGRGDRSGDEARHESSDGSARARGLHRPRHVRRDSRGPARRARRSEVPSLPVAEEIRGRWVARSKDRPRLLQLSNDESWFLQPPNVMSWALIPLTEEQREIQRTARDFGQAEIAPYSDAWDRAEKYDEGIAGKLGELGFLGMLIPEEFDGLGLDTRTYLVALEEIAAVDASVAVLMSVHNSLPDADDPAATATPLRRSAFSSRWRAASGSAPSRSPSPRPAPTRRRCARRRSATATAGCSTAPRRGSRAATTPT